MSVTGGLDAGIEPFVRLLQSHSIETFESCEGGPGHAFPEPTIRFHGGQSQGLLAAYIALTFGPLPIRALRRAWRMTEGELTGPDWEMTFYRQATLDDSLKLPDAS